MSSPANREHARFRVNLKVRYEKAREFVIEYAENLSMNGLFLRGEHDLESRERLSVELDLPGLGKFPVVVEVVHVLQKAMADTLGREAGMGCQIVQSPPGFEEAMTAYLVRLGRRADHIVLVGAADYSPKLSGAGYQAVPAPTPNDVAAAISGAAAPVLAAVVPEGQQRGYAAAFTLAGAPSVPVFEIGVGGLDVVLSALDRQLG